VGLWPFPSGAHGWSSHIWFIGSAVLGAVLPTMVLHDLRLGALGLGLVMACSGIGAVIGTTLSTRLGRRWGTGNAIGVSRLAQPFAIAVVALAPLAAGGKRTGEIYGSPLHWPGELWAAFALAGSGQLLFGMTMGVEGPLEMGYQQAVTPDRLIARMSATRRSLNRGMIVIGAPWAASQPPSRVPIRRSGRPPPSSCWPPSCFSS
jgi:hypothetical protein